MTSDYELFDVQNLDSEACFDVLQFISEKQKEVRHDGIRWYV